MVLRILRNFWLKEFRLSLEDLRASKLRNYQRHVALGDLIFERDETAKFYGFGEGSTCYDNVLIFGDVKVGKNTWIGPNVILDGSGGLEIGDFVSISAGVQVYSHESVNWSVMKGEHPMQRNKTIIGNGVYIGPNAVIQMGVEVGDNSIVGALTLVNKNVAPNSKVFGSPMKIFNTKDSN